MAGGDAGGGIDSNPLENVYQLQRALYNAKKERAFARMQSIYDICQKQTFPTDTRAKADFMSKARTIEPLRKEFVECLDSVNEYEFKIDPSYEIDYQVLDAFDDLFCVVQERYSTLLQARPQQSQVPREIQYVPRMEAPKLDIPKFSGAVEDWPVFYQLFKQSVDQEPRFTNLEKVTRLANALQGSARVVLSSISPTADNYTILLNALVSRYEDKRALASIHIDKLLSFKQLSSESEKGLNSFMEGFIAPINALKQLNIPDLADYVLLHVALKKLDPTTARLFENNYRTVPIPTLDNLITFVSQQGKILSRTPSNSTKPTGSKPNQTANNGKGSTPNSKGFSNHAFMAQDVVVTSKQEGSAVATASTDTSKPSCALCKEGIHPLYLCKIFRKMNIEDRWSYASANRVCFNCLSVNSHLSSACRSANVCPITSCGRPHHKLLHRYAKSNSAAADTSLKQENPATQSTSPANVVATSSLHSACSNQISARSAPSAVLLATAVVIVRDCFGNPQKLRCLLDSGSMSHFVTKSACERLGLNLDECESAVHGIGSSPLRISASTTVDFQSRIDEKFSYTAYALVVDKLTDRLPTTRIDVTRLPHIKHLVLADERFYEPSDIDFLIGAELWPLIVGKKRRLGPPGTPVAVKTTLGYIVMGRAEVESLGKSSEKVCFLTSTPLEELVERYWKVEEVPKRQILKPEDEKCQKIFMDTTVRNPDGTFTVRLPFGQSPSLLGSSKDMATLRFLSLERSLLKKPEIHELYCKLIEEYQADGTISKVGKLAEVDEKNSYFMPHHGVHRPGHVSTPLRIVWNASAVTTSSYSLNNLLLTGPKLQKEILEVLLHFRLFKFAFTADCRRMFLQISINRADRRYQRFVWRGGPNQPLEVYECNKVMFGMSCSPFLAQATVRLLADLERNNFPQAATVVDRDLYVDDVTCSVKGETELIELQHQLESLFKSGGFTLAKWCSNSALLMQQIPEEFRLSTLVNFDDENSCTKVLGVRWLPSDDYLVFVTDDATEDVSCTKRNMLSVLARIFDPMGLISPITVVTKILLKDTWENKVDWDVTPPPSIVQRWDAFKTSLSDLRNIKFDRHVGIESGAETALIGFADSSEKAYGACVYVRTDCNGIVRVQLLCAKSHVASSKVRGIPRLELCAAVLLAKLMRFVIDSYMSRHSFSKIVAFSDSQVVLHWIHSEPHRWKTWVANRIAYVQDQIEPSHWRHVVGEDNPADVISRGTDTQSLLNHHLWFHGPLWLQMSEDNWPPPFVSHALETNSQAACEAKLIVAFPIIFPHTEILAPLLDRISSYRKLLRATAYIFRACTRTNLKKPYILHEELKRAENYWIQYAQNKAYAHEIDRLKRGQTLRATCGLRHLDPFYEGGWLKVGGRLANAKIPFDEKHPILLPSHGKLVDLIIDQYHFDLMHAGAHSLLAIIRLKFWIPAARTRIRIRVRKCNTCFKIKPKPKPPKMADLPDLRVTGCRAFEKVGCDYAGPFMIVTSRQRGKPKLMKAYFCLFICLAVKAVHIELCSDLTTDCFLAAFKRFLSRRGPCSFILSDGGSTFVGARRKLSEIEEFISSGDYEAAVGNELAFRGIEWRFNPPCGPSWGGLWESNIKCIKNHLKRCIGNQYLTYEEFNTVLIQIEAVLNSRPLCVLSNEPNAPAALTPSHFLTLGSTLEHLPSMDVTTDPLNRLQRYELVDRIVQDYWRRWTLEYLHGLQSRSKWRAENDPVEKGTVVLLLDEKLPPLKWPLGIVEEVYPGTDGIGRSVRVRTQKGTYKRPVVKICPLPTQ